MPLTFEQLPEAIGQLFERLDNIERLLQQKNLKEHKQKDEVLSIDQAAEFLRLAKPTVYALVGKRQVPFMKKSKKLYFSTTDLTEWLHENKKEVIQ